MPTSGLKNQIRGGIMRLLTLALFGAGLMPAENAFAQSASTGPTTINVAPTARMTNAKRLGMNIGTQSYYDSGQMLRNITFRNPGFEGEQWQSVLHCATATATSCTDDNTYTAWPANFLKGAKVEFLVGNAAGTFATVTSSTTASVSANHGVTVNLSGVSIPPNAGDFLAVRMETPGNAQAGWWPQTSSGAVLSTEFNDLSPESPGKQALRITVPSGENATLASYIDDYIPGKSFLQMNGVYNLTFRAKSTGGTGLMEVSLQRPGTTFYDQKLTLTDSWKDYNIQMTNHDNGATGALALKFYLENSSVLIDDVALTAAAAADNPTVFRNEVVSALRAYHPGSLRYMDSGYNWGSSIDNMLAVDNARERPGYSNWGTESDQIPIGLHDFLVLCQAIGAEPWYTMQTGMSTQEMTNLMEYLAGPSSSVYGAKRAAMGQTDPWTKVFPVIHLEFGNEVWNTANPGALMNDAGSYGLRAGVIFGAGKASPYYASKSFDFILSGFEVVPSWNQKVLAASSNYDTIDVATYFFTTFDDDSSIEHIFGPMFAEPEAVVDSSSGAMSQQAAVAAGAAHPAKLAVYESQLSINNGKASQSGVNKTQPSLGGGIAQADNMLLAMRDLGVTDQEMFALGGYEFNFVPAAGAAGAAQTTPIWGSVVDMGGQTNLQRPTFLAAQLANMAILPTLLNTSQTGANPTWNQALSANDNVSLSGAHYIQSFAFTDGNKLNVILFNLSRTTALPVNFAGLNAPVGDATISTLVGDAITSNNEAGEQVKITTTTANIAAGSTMTLASFSMTVISVDAPVIPISISKVAVTCPRSSLSPDDSMVCSETVTGIGKYTSDVTWTVDNGTIASDGTYTAPGAVPSSGTATIKVTSAQDKSKSGTFTIALAKESITGVTVACGAKSLGQGTTTNCSANVTGTGSFSNAYTWSITGGSIGVLGNLTAPLTGTSVTVKATSSEDPSKSASTTIALTPVLRIIGATATVTSTTITASWTNTVSSRNGITYSTGGLGSGKSTPYDNTFTTTPEYTIAGLLPNTTYNLWLVAYNNTQNTSQQITVTTAKEGAGAVTGVSVSCGATTLETSGTTTCKAKVSATGSASNGYTWSVSGGSISAAGVLTAPSSGTSVTVTATSTQDGTKSGSATISLTQASAITGVSVTCDASSMEQSTTTNCAATVSGTGTFTKTTTWAVTAGSVNSSGLVTAPSVGSSFVVTATSTQDTTKSASYSIALTTPPATITGVAVTCNSYSVMQGQTTGCSATVSGTHNFSQGYTWSVSAGSINTAGLFTAPLTGTSATVKATSTEDKTKSGSFTINLTPAPMAISDAVVTATSSSITASWTLNVPGRNGVTYSTSTLALGTSTPYDGTFTTSPSFTVTGLQSGTTYNVWLVSYNDTQSVNKMITVTTAGDPSSGGSGSVSGVSVTCPASSLAYGAKSNCTAKVSGKGTYSSAVKWTASAGTISASGALVAPDAGTSLTVVATSVQDATKAGRFSITLLPVVMAISDPVTAVTSTSITVGWTVNTLARNGVTYSTSTLAAGSSTPYDSNFTTSPSYVISGLKSNTVYNLWLVSYNTGQATNKMITVKTAKQ